jgi:transposase
MGEPKRKIRIQELADIYERCAGIDVHKDSVSVCLIAPGSTGKAEGEVQQFGTMTRHLKELSVWLQEHGVTHVVMESTGVYWMPVWQILEAGGFQLLLANAKAVRNMPGKKTDTADCVWLATLLRKGLIQASYIPPTEIRCLRDLCRARTSLVRDRSRVVQRIQKLLETANIKLDSVASDVMGVSGRKMLEELAAGETDPEKLAAHALGRMRPKIPQLVLALEGHFQPHQIFLLRQWLEHFDHLTAKIEQFEKEVEQYVLPFEPIIIRLDAMPGIDRISGITLLRMFTSEVLG